MVGWPVGVVATSGGRIAPLEGVNYHLHNVRWTALRLQFDLNLSEPWTPWCHLQTSYDIREYGVGTAGDPWFCTPDSGWTGYNGQCFQRLSADPAAAPVAVDCGWAMFCNNHEPCSCTASGCDAAPGPTLSFDIALRDDEGSGSERYFEDTHNVRLIRASH
jgi:hypothetical protein